MCEVNAWLSGSSGDGDGGSEGVWVSGTRQNEEKAVKSEIFE